jgi:hypothetical protein
MSHDLYHGGHGFGYASVTAMKRQPRSVALPS